MEHAMNVRGREARLLRPPIKRACFDCHTRKVKCDASLNGFPCSNCRSANIDCTVVARRKRLRGSGRNTTAQVQRREIASNSVEEAISQNDCTRVMETAMLPTHEDSRDEDERQSVAPAEGVGEDELAKQQLSNFFSQNLQETPIRARLTYVGSELSNLNYLVRQRSVNRNVYHYPCTNSYITRVQWNSQVPAACSIFPKDAFIIPPMHISDVLIADYFKFIHPGFPIINKDQFLSLYNGQQSAPSLLLLQAVFLAGSHVTTAFKNKKDLKVSFFRRAKALFDGRYEEDRMEMVQAALLLTWFSDGGDDVCANAWWWIGAASRIAIGLGMHREVRFNKMPDEDKRTWKRIWWCLVQFDCLVSLCYGRPNNIDLDDCDMPTLTPEDFDTSTSTKEANFVINNSNLCALVSHLVRSHFSLRAIKEVSRRARLDIVDARLAGWLDELPPDFRQEAALRPTGDSNPLPLLLHLTYNTSLVLFHRPVEAGSEIDTDSVADEEICVEATSNIIHIFEQLNQQSSLHLCSFWAPSSLFTALLHLRGQLGCKNPILSRRANEKYQFGMQSLQKLSHYWLFAISIWNLFVTISNKAAPETRENQTDTIVAQGPQDTIPPTEPLSITCAETAEVATAERSQPREAEWVQLFVGEGPRSGHATLMEQNRWQDHLQEWQSLYWSDPLAGTRLQENFGEYLFDWP